MPETPAAEPAGFVIRDEEAADRDAIADIVAQAFRDHPYSNQRESALIDALREAGALTIGLVAEAAGEAASGEVVGHVAFSPVTIGDMPGAWYALGPLAVRPDRQRAGIGAALVREGLVRLRRLGAAGCVLVGDPAYYARFGFAANPALQMPGIPSEFVLALPLAAPTAPRGIIEHHPAFAAFI